MQITRDNRARLTVIAIAFALSLLSGLGSLFGQAFFGGATTMSGKISQKLFAFLWVLVLICVKYPRAGLFLFAMFICIGLLLCFDMTYYTTGLGSLNSCSIAVPYNLISGLLLLVNVILAKRETDVDTI